MGSIAVTSAAHCRLKKTADNVSKYRLPLSFKLFAIESAKAVALFVCELKAIILLFIYLYFIILI